MRDCASQASIPGALASRAVCLGILAIVLCSAPGPVWGDPPPGYYGPALGLSGAALRAALHDIIDDHTVIPHSGGPFDTHDAIDLLQEDPSNPANVIIIYSGFSVPKSSWPDYNREHLWPISLGAEQGTPAYSDMFNVYGADADVNSQRGNRYFDECLAGCSIPPEAPLCRYDDDSWEPRDGEKGDLARALLYMDVRYSGDVGNEPDLELDDLPTAPGCDCMGLLSVLLAWHAQDPPDAAEMERNDTICDDIQGNRNPFVDHPEFVDALWGGGPPVGGGELWINEIHYDNSGTDVDEGVEVAGEAGSVAPGWSLVAYNGSTGVAYATATIVGVVPDEQNGFGALWVPIPGLQNGDPDGVALVDETGVVVEFLSYEGEFTATDGPAAGLASVDIGVSEASGTPVGASLQRVGSGDVGPEFVWTGPAPHSRGSLNVGQTIIAGGGASFIRGDCSGDGSLLLNDALLLLDFLFGDGALGCLDACDMVDDGMLALNDPVVLLGYLFAGGAPPPPPFPACGADPTLDPGGDLGCASFPAC